MGSDDPKCHKTVVPVTTLDAIYRAYPDVMRRVLIMKLDTEGFDGRAVLGAENFMREAPPCLLQMELRPARVKLAGTPVEEIFEYLESKGYSTEDARTLLDKGTLRKTDAFFWQTDFAKCISQRSGKAIEAVRQAIADLWMVSDEIRYR